MYKIFTTILFVIINLTYLFAAHIGDGYNGRVAVPDRKIYSIQVASVPEQSKEGAFALYDTLKQYSELVYYEKVRIGKKDDWIRVKIGLCKTFAQAEILKERLVNSLGEKIYITKDSLLIREQGPDCVVKTFNAIWAKTDNKWFECYDFGKLILTGEKGHHDWDFYTQPFFVPGRNEVIYEFDNQIYRTDIHSGETKIVDINKNRTERKIGIINSVPQISSSGQYLAFISDNLWESESSLWIYANDSTLKLVSASNPLAVKNFRWHPQKDIIFFVFGFPWGTVSVGGDIYATDMNGKQVKLLERNKKIFEEITMDIEIDDNYLYYKTVLFDKYGARIYKMTDNKISLDELMTIFNSK